MEKRTLESTLMAWPATDTLATAGIANLRELAENLRTRQHAHDRFDFAYYNIGYDAEEGRLCGTAGCAVGDLPLLRPDAFEFHPNAPAMITLRTDLLARAQDWEAEHSIGFEGNTVLSVMWWFRISREMFTHLFIPLEQHDDFDTEYTFESQLDIFHRQAARFGGKPLGESATAGQVADNIEDFCQRVEAAWERIKADWTLIWKGADHAL
jgi:hypothetical protein